MISLFHLIENIKDQVTTSPPLGKVTLAANAAGDELYVTFEELRPAGDYEEPVTWNFKLSND